MSKQVHEDKESSPPLLWNSFVDTGIHKRLVLPAVKCMIQKALYYTQGSTERSFWDGNWKWTIAKAQIKDLDAIELYILYSLFYSECPLPQIPTYDIQVFCHVQDHFLVDRTPGGTWDTKTRGTSPQCREAENTSRSEILRAQEIGTVCLKKIVRCCASIVLHPWIRVNLCTLGGDLKCKKLTCHMKLWNQNMVSHHFKLRRALSLLRRWRAWEKPQTSTRELDICILRKKWCWEWVRYQLVSEGLLLLLLFVLQESRCSRGEWSHSDKVVA